MCRALPLVAAIVAASGTALPPADAAPWTWPVRGEIVSRFHTVPDPYASGQRRGVAIAAPAGTVVRAACAGSVTFVGPVADNGLTVAIACGALSAAYTHLGSVTTRSGARLERGERLGTVGTTGRTRRPGAQLGLSARVRGRRHGYVDPLRLLGEAPPARPAAPLAPPRGPRPPVGLPVRPLPPPRSMPARPAAHPRPVSVTPRSASPVGGGLPLGRLWVPLGGGLVAAGVGGAGFGLLRRRRRSSAAARAATRTPA